MAADLSVLNEEQREAVLDREHNLLLLACAGSGKTRTITTKIAYYIEERILYPWQILAVTFTNKAAKEMRDRVSAMLPDEDLSGMQLRTFHSFGAYVLRMNAEAAELSPNFCIYDDDESLALLQLVYPDKDKKKLRQIYKTIAKAKDLGMDPDSTELLSITDEPDIRMYFREYENALRSTGNCDFADLITLTVHLFEDNPDIAEHYRRKYRMVLVDEYQDSNRMQFELLRILNNKDTQLVVVGDDDQSIYSFRGAEIKNILTFTKAFENVRSIKLEKNYRSTAEILDVARSIIKNNKERHQKDIVSGTGRHGAKPELLTNYSAREEAETIAEMIRRTGDPDNTAILYRTNAQSLEFETVFSKMRIPYKLVGALRFYDREEIKDALALLLLLVNRHDIVNFRRMINKPTRGLGPKTVEKIIERVPNGDLITNLELFAEESNGRAREGAVQFLEAYKSAEEDLRNSVNLGDLLLRALTRFGVMAMIENEPDKSVQKARKENLSVLAGSLAEAGVGREALYQYLENITLDTSTLGGTGEESDEKGVTLITMHNTKGLEYDRVFMVGLEDELIPGMGDEDIEEERRIFYVAATRARKTLYLSFAKNRMQWGQYQAHHPSRFLKQIPENMYTGKLRRQSSFDGAAWDMVGQPISRSGQSYGGGSCYSSKPKTAEHRPEWARHINTEKPKAVKKPAEPLDVTVGDVVSSPSFGKGKIVHMEGEPGNRMITVQFSSGQKRLTERFSGLKKDATAGKHAAVQKGFKPGDRVRSDIHGEGVIKEVEMRGVNRILTVEFKKGVIQLMEAFAKIEKI